MAFSHMGVGKMQNFQTQEGNFFCVAFIVALFLNPILDSAAKCANSVGLFGAGISQTLKYCFLEVGKNITLGCSQAMDCNKIY